MKFALKKSFLLCLMMAMIISAVPMSVMAEKTGEPVITSYTVKDAEGTGMSSFKKNAVVNMVLSIKDTNVGSDLVTSSGDIDVSKLVDSFSGGSASVNLTSSESGSITYEVTLTGLKYSGSGKSIKVMIGYKNSDKDYATLELNVKEATEYVESTKEETVKERDPDPTPMVIVSSEGSTTPIKAGEEREVTIKFENLNRNALWSPVVTITPSDSIMLLEDRSSFALDTINGFKTRTLKVKIKATNTIAAANQSLGIEMKFNYDNRVSTVQGTISDRVNIPAVVKEKATNFQPTIIVTRSAVKTISANDTFDMTITLKNAGKITAEDPVAVVSASDALLIQNDTSTFILGNIKAGESKSINLSVKAGKEISSTTQSINVDLKFVYDSGDGLTQATVSEKVNLSANVSSTSSDGPVPNIIINNFSYGGEYVIAGEKFPLSFTFVNTGKIAIENIVATIDGGESFTMDDSTNTFYYSRVGAGASKTQRVPMQALSSAKTGAQTATVSFKYEYVDGSKRGSSSTEIKLSMPLFQPDRFQVIPPTLPEIVYAGEEISLSLPFVNKSKSEISNVEATVEGNVETPSKTQYLGNFEAGKSGNIGFVITPMETGQTEILLKVSYEDANQQINTLEFPVTLEVQEQVMDPYMYDDPGAMEETGSGGAKKWIIIILILAVLAAGVIFGRKFIKKRKAKAAETSTAWDDWDDEIDEPDDFKSESDDNNKGESRQGNS